MANIKKIVLASLLASTTFAAMPAFAKGPIILTLRDAVALAIRNNPTLEQDELSRITAKFGLMVQENAFDPQYSLTGSSTFTHDVSDGTSSSSTSFGLNPTVSLKNHYGTQFSLSSTNSMSEGVYNPGLTFKIVQPLIQGFGKPVVDAALDNAKDSEVVNRLNFKQAAITTVTQVINDYLALVGDYQAYAVAQQTLKTYETTIKNDKAMIAAGRMAESSIVQVKAKIAQQKASIQTSQNQINVGKNTLLNDLGLPPYTAITLPKKFNFKRIEKEVVGPGGLPNLKESEKLALANSISYQTGLITIRDTRRSLLVAKDQQRWKLNVTAQETVGDGSGGGENAGLKSLTNGENRNSSVSLNLTVPIDDMSAQSNTVNQEVSLDKSLIALKESKRSLIESVRTDYNTVVSDKKSLDLSVKALALNRQTVYISEQKQLAGQVSTFQVLTDQKNLAEAEQGLVSDETNYLQAIVSYEQQLSITLQPWDIKLRY